MLLKYLGALWKKSFLKQVLSFAYLLPVMLVIFTSLLQMVLPGYSNYQFYKRSNLLTCTAIYLLPQIIHYKASM